MNDNLQEFSNVINQAFIEVWLKLVSYIPKLIVALIIFLIGWLVAIAIGSLIERLVRYTRIDGFLKKTGIMEKLNLKELSLSRLIGKLMQFFIIVITLAIIGDTLNLPQITDFLNRVLLYLPNVFIAAIIFALGLIAANITDSLLQGILAPSAQAKYISKAGKYTIILFTSIIVLDQLSIAPELVRIFFAGLMLAFALAFGLGGKNAASKFIDKIGGEESEKNNDIAR